MKVLHIYRTCYPETQGGIEHVIRSITEGGGKLGITNKILTLSNERKQPYKISNVEIIPIKKDIEIAANGFSIKLISKFKELAQWADIIHYHYPWPSGDFLAFFSNKPSIVTYHSDIVRQKMLNILYKPLEQYFLNKVDAIIATSPQYAQSSKNLKKFESKVSIIPLAINEDNYSLSKSEIIANWRDKVGEGFFLFVGVLRYYKGLKYLIQAAAINKLPVVIVGDGPLFDTLNEQVQKLELSNVTFVGFVSECDKIALLQLSKSFVFPSHLRSEAFGVSLLEAQLFSKPLISCNIGTGSSYVNQHEQTGLIVAPADPKALSDAMEYINSQPELAKHYGENSYRRLKKMFTNDIQCSKYLTIYQKLMEKK